jgi:hypothetical protein
MQDDCQVCEMDTEEMLIVANFIFRLGARQ